MLRNYISNSPRVSRFGSLDFVHYVAWHRALIHVQSRLEVTVVSHEFRFIFVHINCCAGTSIERALRQWGDWQPEDRPGLLFEHSQHSNLAEYLRAYPESREYLKFTVVRNPWARMATYYATHRRYHRFRLNQWIRGRLGFKTKRAPADPVGFKNWVKQLGERDETRTLYDHSRMYSSCASWIADGEKPRIDFVGRFENLAKDFATIAEMLKLPATLPHLNKSRREHYSEYYDDESVEVIRRRFNRDVELFGYSFGD